MHVENNHIAITRVQLEEVSLGAVAFGEAAEPGLGPAVLAVEAVALALVGAALAAGHDLLGLPAEGRVDVGDVLWVGGAGVAGQEFVHGLEGLPHAVVRDRCLDRDEGLELGAEHVACGRGIDTRVVVVGGLDEAVGGLDHGQRAGGAATAVAATIDHRKGAEKETSSSDHRSHRNTVLLLCCRHSSSLT